MGRYTDTLALTVVWASVSASLRPLTSVNQVRALSHPYGTLREYTPGDLARPR